MVATKESRESLAKELVDEALEGFRHTVPPAELEAIRILLEMELLCTEKGAEMLRSCEPDPVVDHSDTVAKEPATTAKARKSSGKS